MQNTTTTIFQTAFEEEVYKGLIDFPKHLSSKFFYDERGDKLFQDIMNMPEYYLTDLEHEILETHKHEIMNLFTQRGKHFNLIEMGAGDGKKTKILLRYFLENNIDFKYQPIDISQNVLNQLEKSVLKDFPEIQLETRQGTYFEALKNINIANGAKKVILFLGSNIGNLLHPQAIDFLTNVQEFMQSEDLLFVGFDQKKNPQIVLDAYNDKTGITAAFNKNILTRINKELGGNFELDHFLHWEVYDPETGTAKSFLVAKKAHSVYIDKLGLEVNFKRWETIHTEISQKYDDAIITNLAEKSGLNVVTHFRDPNNHYKNYVFKKEN